MFGDGWPLVVEANHIGIGDIITFTLHSESEMKFRIYDPKDSMEKNIKCPIDGSTEVMLLLDSSSIMYSIMYAKFAGMSDRTSYFARAL